MKFLLPTASDISHRRTGNWLAIPQMTDVATGSVVGVAVHALLKAASHFDRTENQKRVDAMVRNAEGKPENLFVFKPQTEVTNRPEL